MEHRDNINLDYEHDVQSGEELGLNVVTTVERNYDAEISLSHPIISKAEVIESHIQPFKLNQELLNQANAYYLAQQYKSNTDLHFYHQKQYQKNLEDFYRTVERLNEDECRSLVYTHNMYILNTSDKIDLDKGSSKSILINIFKAHQHPIQYFHDLMQFKTTKQLPDALLSWIKNNIRHSIFIAYMIQNNLNDKTLVGSIELTDYILNYLKYEIINFNNAQLIFPYYRYLSQPGHKSLISRIELIKSTYFNNRTYSEIKWFRSDDSIQIEWAYNYLSSDKRDYLILQKTFIPVSLEEKYNLILASLDVLSNVEYTYESLTQEIDMNDTTIDLESIPKISYRAKIIENMKDAWAKFSASNKNEDLSEIKIYKKNQDQLDSIMKIKGTTANKIISQMIEDEYKRNFNKD